MIDFKYLLLLGLFFAFLSGLAVYSTVNNFIMLVVLITYGYISFTSSDKNVKILALCLLFLLAVSNIYLNGIRWGLDFAGGTRIPVTLESPVSDDVMQNIVTSLKTRASTLGLEQVKVQAIGNDRIFIEVPSDNEETLKRIESAITQQGVYKGVVDGKVVISGTDILPGTIYQIASTYAAQMGADWGVAFSVTPDAAKKFAANVKGKGNYPLYMYLDMPSGATLVLNREKLSNITSNITTDLDSVIIALDEALDNEAGKVEMEYEDSIALLDNMSSNTTYIVEVNSTLDKALRARGAKVISYSADGMYPEFSAGSMLFVNQWKAIGLISAPVLSPDITKGSISLSYTISGNAPIKGSSYERQVAAENEAKSITSVLKGGAFPVKLSAGSKTYIPATLGEKFLNYSIIAILASLVAVILFLTLAFSRRIELVLPMLLITVAELVILISIVGSFTIDLPAMAGIIASAGISVDAQIVITGELLRREDKKDAIKRAFSIINNNALVATVSMLPLFFVNIVEVVGFAVSSIFAYALGVLVSRPAYSAIVEDIITKKGEQK
jgi:preprotein translocase subunit SecD